MKKILAILFILAVLGSPIIESKVMASADELPKVMRSTDTVLKMSNSPIDQFNLLK